jgi:hypothetical protein
MTDLSSGNEQGGTLERKITAKILQETYDMLKSYQPKTICIQCYEEAMFFDLIIHKESCPWRQLASYGYKYV